MTVERRVETLPTNGRLVLPPNNFLFLLNIPNPIDVRFKRGGTTFGAIGATAGYVKKLKDHWDECVITGTAGDTITFFVGWENFNEDDTDVRLQIATISGTVTVDQTPNSAFVDTPSVNAPSGVDTQLFPANLARKAITVFSDNANGAVTLRPSNGGSDIAQMNGGGFLSWRNTDALFVHNATGSACTFYILEET